MRRRTLRLRTQLAAAMIGAVLLAVLFGYGGIMMFVRWEEQTLLRSLDAATRSAAATIAHGGQPDARAVTALYLDTRNISRRVDQDIEVVLLVLAALASSFGIWVGIRIAGRLARPIEAVSAAARELAGGDLGSRASVSRAGSDELATLVADFNAMADVLQRYDREVGESSAAIAHELRTPLAILRARLQAHQDGLIDSGAKSSAILIAQVELLTRIVDDLQVLGMARSGRLELDLEEIDVAAFLADMVPAIATLLEGAAIRLDVDLRPCLIAADRLRLRQVILALADNVRRHARPGGLMQLTCGPDDDGVCIIVADDGPGIPPALRKRIFERFWRAEPSRTRAHGGSGLGLAVCAAIVEAHGGIISVDGALNGGALFAIRVATGARIAAADYPLGQFLPFDARRHTDC
jgi:two-component system sensor histidine kinase BaeS/two-component system sensor histidine kinase AdeS